MEKSEIEQKFLSLVDSYKQVIYKVCFMYATDDETISDLYQEVVLNLWTAFPRFRSESKPSTWVYRISVNTCISHLRHNIKRPETVSLTMSMGDLFPEESERAQLQKLYQLISQLGELERALILLWLDDKSYEEIAKIRLTRQSPWRSLTKTPTIFNGLSFKFATFATWNIKQT